MLSAKPSVGEADWRDARCRFPFLLVDRVLELETQKYCIAYKNVTVNDNFFTGHFPERKIMPGKYSLYFPPHVFLVPASFCPCQPFLAHYDIHRQHL
jgi:hypothetical protein